jgi:hypothetical protein
METPDKSEWVVVRLVQQAVRRACRHNLVEIGRTSIDFDGDFALSCADSVAWWDVQSMQMGAWPR